MKRLYWRPKRVSRTAVVFLGIMSTVGIVAVEEFRVEGRQPGFDQRIQAANLAHQCLDAVKEERLRLGHAIDWETDPTGSGLVGQLMTPVTSVSGDLGAKQTTINPNFAAAIVDMLQKARVGRGDVVAIGFTGSFPALNISVLAALQTLEAKPVIISSASASQFGANLPDLMWIDMERLLHEKGLLQSRSVACSMGGYEDQGGGLSPEAHRLIDQAIQRNHLRPIKSNSFTESIDQRMAIYHEHAGRQPIKAYINVGGGAVSVGKSIGKRTYKAGLNRKPPRAALKIDSVMTRLMREGAPALHLVQVREIAEEYGLPAAPAEMPRIGEGPVYYRESYNMPLAGGLLVAIFAGLYAFVLSDVGLRLLKGAARQHDSPYPQAAV
jgi:poly-gamma-glutamate system protein